jgi:hypothetical protein
MLQLLGIHARTVADAVGTAEHHSPASDAGLARASQAQHIRIPTNTARAILWCRRLFAIGGRVAGFRLFSLPLGHIFVASWGLLFVSLRVLNQVWC